MNILLINHYAGGDRYGMEFRPFYMAREWNRLGHDTTILCASYSHLRGENPKVEQDFSEEYIEGVRYVWVKTPVYKRNNPTRLLNIITFYQKVKRHLAPLVEKYRPDVAIGSSTYPHDMYLVNRIHELCGAGRCFELHDPWPATMMEIYSYSPNHIFTRYIARAEKYAYTQCDAVVSIWGNIDERMRELQVDTGKFHHIPNCVVLDAPKLPAPDHVSALISELHAQGKFVVMYLGGFAIANALDELILASASAPEDVAFLLIGSGQMKEEYERLAKAKGGEQVYFLPFVPKSQVHETLKLADALYIGAKKCTIYRYGIGMNKLYDYMYAGRPVIFGIDTPDNPVAKSGGGVSIEASSAEEILKAVVYLKDCPPDILREMGQHNQEYIRENHNYRKKAEEFADILAQIAKK